MIRIRGGSGLGDALYIRPIVDHFVRDGRRVTALSDYPDVFLGSGASVEPFRRHAYDVVAHYVSRKSQQGSTQWQDVCASAGLKDLEFRMPWEIRNPALVEKLRSGAAGRPIILVHGGRAPMARKDGFGMELLPDRRAFGSVLMALRDCYRVQVGRAKQIYPLDCDLDLNGSTSVADLLDVAMICDAVVCQCSFAIPLAEIFDKDLLAIWSARVELAPQEFVRLTRPEKVLSGSRSRAIYDNQPHDLLEEAAHALRCLH